MDMLRNIPTAPTAVQICEKGEPMNNVLWSVALKNSVVIICWTFLAWHFDKWWIALFGALFLSSVKWRRTDGN
jgi:hypothetical protein